MRMVVRHRWLRARDLNLRSLPSQRVRLAAGSRSGSGWLCLTMTRSEGSGFNHLSTAGDLSQNQGSHPGHSHDRFTVDGATGFADG
jgi:hypothetical protein